MTSDIPLGRLLNQELRVAPGFPFMLGAECEWTDKLKESLSEKGIVTEGAGKFPVHLYFEE